MQSGLVLILAAVFAGSASAQVISPEQKAIVAYVDTNEQASNALLEKLANINSGTHNL
jgi:hypothetical protein